MGLEWEGRKSIMKAYAMKLKRSGWPATTRHQVVKEVVEKWDQACQMENEGVRPIHRAREWPVASRRQEKEQKMKNWQKMGKDQVLAPLILDPTDGDITVKMKQECVKFQEATGFHVTVRTRAGWSVKRDGKPEPFREKGCWRDNCLCCSTGNAGNCERNSVGYTISCQACHLISKYVVNEGEYGCNAYSRGLEH